MTSDSATFECGGGDGTASDSAQDITSCEERILELLPDEFLAAFISVRLSGMYAAIEQFDDIIVATNCLLAAWGYSDTVRLLVDVDLLDIMSAVITKIDSVDTARALTELARSMPFMDLEWRPDDNDNEPLPRAVASLLHDWNTRTDADGAATAAWATNRDCVKRAMRYCGDVGRFVASNHRTMLPRETRRSLATQVCNDMFLCEIGAQLADIVSPFGGDSSTPRRASCRHCCTCVSCVHVYERYIAWKKRKKLTSTCTTADFVAAATTPSSSLRS